MGLDASGTSRPATSQQQGPADDSARVGLLAPPESTCLRREAGPTAPGPTVGVLTPFVGGGYYGTLLAAIAEAVSRLAGRVIAVQTLDAGSYVAEAGTSSDTVALTAWDHVDGFISIVGAVDAEVLRRVRTAGKPVVQIGDRFTDLGCPAVLTDNHTGTRQAVEHLIGHGHTRIAFVGQTRVSDVRERYDAYRAALEAHGIEPDPDLFFDAADCLETGGEDAARHMMSAGLPSTAVVAATDLNAIGVMRVLAASGHRLPGDQAIVGFDDVDAAPYVVPALSSVAQSLDLLGVAAVDLLVDQLRGRDVPVEPQRMATTFVPRASCGCAGPGHGTVSSPAGTARDQLVDALTALMPPAPARPPAARRAVTDAAEAIAAAVEDAATGTPAPAADPLPAAAATLYAAKPGPEAIATIARAVRDFADRVTPPDAAPAAAVHRVAAVVHHVTVLVAEAQAHAQFTTVSQMRDALSSQYDVGMELLHNRNHDPRALRWLARTPATGGSLALRVPTAEPAPVPTLDVVGTFIRGRRDHGPASPGTCSATAFPPRELIAAAAPDQVVFVVPAKVNGSDWGLLAVVDRVESRVQNGREGINQYAALLTVALDLRDQERQLRRAALYDSLTGLANRSLFLEQLHHAAGRARRHPDLAFAVLFIDLDGFKEINDTLGHAAGDELLVQTAARIAANLRDVDTAARLGGDEFAILLTDIGDRRNADTVVRRLAAAFRQPVQLRGHRRTVHASIGLAFGDADHHSPEDLLRTADSAMYAVKSRRRSGPGAGGGRSRRTGEPHLDRVDPVGHPA